MMSVLLTIMFLAGIAAIAFGAWLVYEPAGFMVAGAAMVLVPVLYARGGWQGSSNA